MGKIRAFDDLLSWAHFVYAALLAALEPLALIAASMVFVAYQCWEKERLGRKLGDFVEWMAGCLAGVIARWMLKLLGLCL